MTTEVIHSNYSSPESLQIETAFREFDLNGDNLLKPIEFEFALEALGIDVKNPEVKSIILKITDTKVDIDFEIFKEIASRLLEHVEPEHKVITLFEIFDRDRTGKITLENLQHVAERLGEEPSSDQLHSMIELFDEDGDGALNISEFLEIFKEDDDDDDLS